MGVVNRSIKSRESLGSDPVRRLVLLFNECSLPSALEVYMLGVMGCIGVLLLSAKMEKNTKYLSAILSGLGKITMVC